MAWYDNGIQGKEKPFPTSAALTQPGAEQGISVYSCPDPVIIGSFSLNSNKGQGETYSILLNTFSLGTQLYLNVHTITRTTVDYFSAMVPYVTTYMTHGYNMTLKNGSNTLTLTGGNADSFLTDYYPGNAPIDLGFSIYGYWYAANNGNRYPQSAFPFGGSGAMLNNSIICVADSSGLSFYKAGYSVDGGPYGAEQIYINYPCPVSFICRIPATVLNDPKWFDPDADKYDPASDSSGGFGVGGNVPELPISPSYPGTNMDFPSLPTGASALGFNRLTLYKPSSSNLSDALDILYSDSDESTLETIIESCKKWWYKPEQYCISLMLSAVDASTSASKSIKFGKYDSEVVAPYVSSQWQVTDCGSINIPLKYGSFLDFEPHAKLKIYLPYIGLRTLNANECIGGTIAIKYYTDMLSGSSVCMMLVSRQGSNNTILYTFDCNVSMQIPLTSENYNTVISQLLSAGVAAGVAAAGPAGAGVIAAGAAGSMINAAANLGSPELTQSGNLSPNSGVLSYPKPYVCVQMPIPTTPANYNTEKGRPSNIYMSLSECKGFTVINNLHVDIPNITDEEISMIRNAFHKGVYM